ncbi:hypothetical protein SGRA_0905 [Saprospira grandis str. Lewin]|uniref:Uncharacterized protein n=1 Tax=Saprospira grandis (strain Lewin) TaxID=984262 RepID=H6L2I3_SAPGL|nr:hypothetical protein SGRA_0905 [Saprospira grandis str. Lewin]
MALQQTGGAAAAKARSAAAEGWIRVAEGQSQRLQAAQGRAELRALTQPDPSENS